MIKRMDQERPVPVLTRSYGEAQTIYKMFRKRAGHRYCRVMKLESGEDASTQDDRITDFDGWDTGKKALIGPGDRIGTGNDIQTVEVGINLGWVGQECRRRSSSASGACSGGLRRRSQSSSSTCRRPAGGGIDTLRQCRLRPKRGGVRLVDGCA